LSAEATGYLLLEFDHMDISFRQIIVFWQLSLCEARGESFIPWSLKDLHAQERGCLHHNMERLTWRIIGAIVFLTWMSYFHCIGVQDYYFQRLTVNIGADKKTGAVKRTAVNKKHGADTGQTELF
jgi:hypothetical protein